VLSSEKRCKNSPRSAGWKDWPALGQIIFGDVRGSNRTLRANRAGVSDAPDLKRKRDGGVFEVVNTMRTLLPFTPQ
jgi:hypothetical protein